MCSVMSNSQLDNETYLSHIFFKFQYADKNVSAPAAQQQHIVSCGVSAVTTTSIVTTHSTGVDVNPGFSAVNHEESCLQNADLIDPTPR